MWRKLELGKNVRMVDIDGVVDSTNRSLDKVGVGCMRIVWTIVEWNNNSRELILLLPLLVDVILWLYSKHKKAWVKLIGKKPLLLVATWMKPRAQWLREISLRVAPQ
jgi:hypothetical protein